MMDMNYPNAKQGIRRPGIPDDITKLILYPGDLVTFITPGSGVAKKHVIGIGTIGIVHCDEDIFVISVIRDDCKAARKAIKDIKGKL